MQLILAVLLPVRVVLVLLCTVLGLVAQLALFWWISPQAARTIVTRWSRVMLFCLGVKVYRFGNPTIKNALFVSNHISWLDILTLQAESNVVFVAKSEIKSWPILGWMVSLAGTCFIERDRRTALRNVHSTLSSQLSNGKSVCIFPEGTTTDGDSVLQFHGGLMQAAIDAKVAIQPIRLDYSHKAAAYIGDTTLIGSLKNILLASPSIDVRIQFLPCITTDNTKRQDLALLSHRVIHSANRMNVRMPLPRG